VKQFSRVEKADWVDDYARPACSKGIMIRTYGRLVQALDTNDWKTLWSTKVPGILPLDTGLKLHFYDLFSTPAIGLSNVYLTSKDGHIVSLRLSDGKINFSYATGQPMLFQPILAEGNLYASTACGNIICLKIGPDAVGWNQWGGNSQHDHVN
jgi:outer membrane protein assembly factor BamB